MQAPGIRTVAVSSSRNAGIPIFLRKLLDKSTVENIYVVDCPVRMKRRIKSDLLSSNCDHDRIVFCNRYVYSFLSGNERKGINQARRFSQASTGKSVTERISTKSTSTVNTRQLPEYIIKRILEYALMSFELLNETLFSDGVEETRFHMFKKTYCSLSQVSKLFLVRAAVLLSRLFGPSLM